MKERPDSTDRVGWIGLLSNCSIYINNHRSTHIDAPVDFGQRSFNSEQIPLEPNPNPKLPLVDRLAAKRFRFAGFPLKFIGANGAPLRAVVILRGVGKE